jgi:hypothetical protein
VSNSKTLGLHPGKSFKLMSIMSFYLICRMYVQLTHLALPKLFYVFSLAFQLLFEFIWAGTVLICVLRNTFHLRNRLTSGGFPTCCLAKKRRPKFIWNHWEAAWCKESALGFAPGYSWVQILALLFPGSRLQPLWASQSDYTKCSWHTEDTLWAHVCLILETYTRPQDI